MRITTTFAQTRVAARGVTALVPTMGFLHEGHLALIEAARERADTVVVSLFVNPLQFSDDGDLERYPRDEGRDAALAGAAGGDLLFAPPLAEMYPVPPATRVSLPALSAELEGPYRPGHLDGVALVVAKLYAGLTPQIAFFGRKDAQQLALVTRLAADLSFPVEVVGCPTVREEDGLALSSRNVFLPAADRGSALSISRGLMAAADAAGAGERSGAVLEGLVAAEMEAAGLAQPDYVALADAAAVTRIPVLDRPAFLAVAVRVGPVRLIDNVRLEPDGTADRGRWLGRPSILYAGGA
ncbi:MAG TPA: pantoate--beta-alanine ligase [Acidimicrobiia bacterium]|nr:pantoate--beta-alanine ligase [Acidimicrobiia bacterium]